MFTQEACRVEGKYPTYLHTISVSNDYTIDDGVFAIFKYSGALVDDNVRIWVAFNCYYNILHSNILIWSWTALLITRPN